MLLTLPISQLENISQLSLRDLVRTKQFILKKETLRAETSVKSSALAARIMGIMLHSASRNFAIIAKQMDMSLPSGERGHKIATLGPTMITLQLILILAILLQPQSFLHQHLPPPLLLLFKLQFSDAGPKMPMCA